jgi:hypothetical protein
MLRSIECFTQNSRLIAIHDVLEKNKNQQTIITEYETIMDDQKNAHEKLMCDLKTEYEEKNIMLLHIQKNVYEDRIEKLICDLKTEYEEKSIMLLNEQKRIYEDKIKATLIKLCKRYCEDPTVSINLSL